jgi:hypothetical protein
LLFAPLRKSVCAATESLSEGGVTVAPLERLGREIVARIEAGDKAKDRADQMYKSAGLQLIEARNRVPDFSAFLRDHCDSLSRSRAYELMAIAEGRTTTEETRAKSRARAQRSRANKASVSATSRTRGVSTKKPPPRMSQSQRALAEFKVAVHIYFAKMDDDAKREAVA